MTITVSTRYIAPAEATLPGLAVQITQLVDSYMIWVGATRETAGTVGDAPRSGSLCKDWACGMPSGTATTLYRTSGSDVASAMAQRLARRVGRVVFLSVDVPSNMVETAERGIVASVRIDRP